MIDFSLRDEKECEVYIVLTPVYEGRANGKSLPVYKRLGTVSCCFLGNCSNFLLTDINDLIICILG